MIINNNVCFLLNGDAFSSLLVVTKIKYISHCAMVSSMFWQWQCIFLQEPFHSKSSAAFSSPQCNVLMLRLVEVSSG